MSSKLEDVVDIESGLEDGGHIHLRCRSCRAILVDIWQTNPKAIDRITGEAFEWDLQANCPFCKNKSFHQKVHGVFHYGGYGRVKDDNEDDDIPSTVVESIDIIGNVYQFNVKKASPDAKPFK